MNSVFVLFVSFTFQKTNHFEIKESIFFKDIDYIIPVPLHPKKEKIRGYNQSRCIAKGIKEVLKTEIETTTLTRTVDTESQTKKTKYSRWENVGEVFRMTDVEKLKYKHILLIDDVITTGSILKLALQHCNKLKE